MTKIYSILICLILFIPVFAQKKTVPPFLQVESQWVDSVLFSMTLEEQIAQLIMVTAYPDMGEKNEPTIISQIEKYKIGGVLFLKSSPSYQAKLSNLYQSKSKVPLFTAMDAENGLSFRMDSVVNYPLLMALGTVQDEKLIYQMGLEVAAQCKRIGINLNFAPVVDVNSNPYNPVINYRSMGELPKNVAQKSWLLAKGMQDGGVFVSAKHFPGHGDTSKDSHFAFPVIKHSYTRLDTMELVPFKTCIDSGINGMMTAHINITALDNSKRPATLSKAVMTDLLRDSLGFQGLTFSDAMNMGGITLSFSEEDATVEALKAGVDVVEFIINPGKVIQTVKNAVSKGVLSEELITEKCRRVLLAKHWLGLNAYQAVSENKVAADLNHTSYELTRRLLFEKALTVLKNENDLLPLQRLDTLKIASVSVFSNEENPFQNRLDSYANVDHFVIGENMNMDELPLFLKELKNYNLVLVSVHGLSMSASKKYSVSDLHKAAIVQLSRFKNCVVSFYCNPYALNQFEVMGDFSAILLNYGENEFTQESAAQLIFGAIDANGKLPVGAAGFKAGTGLNVSSNYRLKFTIPEEVGISASCLKSKVDSFANLGITQKAFPGCQVLIAKNGKVIFNETYGYFTYDSVVPVQTNNIYDWASLTKITGPLPLIMQLTENSILKLDEPFSNYWPDFKGTEEEDVTLREILCHQARFKPWIPFYLNTMKDNKKYQRSVFRTKPSAKFPYRVSSNLYVNMDYKQKIYSAIRENELFMDSKYRYSDLCFYLFPEMISNITGADYETLLKNEIFKPLGANTVTYNAYKNFPQRNIVPTENDGYFRKELIQGYVHDEGCAMMGGVSGNAGLFGSTIDLAKIMQMYLQKGYYGGVRFFKPETVNEFTSIQYEQNENRRGIGFDKPYIDNYKKKLSEAYPAPSSSANSFGHSGFTGTFAWADPDSELLFIFMSNRVYPSRENGKIYDLNIRPALHQAIYDCLGSFKINEY